jgi:uncharacterized protein YvpB
MTRLFRILAMVMVLSLAHTTPAQGDSVPDSAYVTGVSGHAQGYSLSCESRSAADFAGYWGINIGETEFLNALPESDNPDEGFVGSANDAWGSTPPFGYGVHADPVASTLQAFGLDAAAHHDVSWDDLRAEIAAGKPVIVWVIGQMWGGTAQEYTAEDGSTSIVAAYEHTMILTGYSAEAVQVVDAYSGQYQSYWLKTFLKSWGVLGNMAVFGPDEVQSDSEEPQAQSSEGTYKVEAGDYLVALAERFGVTWQELAELNAIPYPWTIFTGQVLQLPVTQNMNTESEPASTPAQLASPVLDYPYTTVLPVVQRGSTYPVLPTTSNSTTTSIEP